MTAFLTGAKDRLLPASVPFRYFGAAAGFHLLFWLVLLAGAPELPGYIGGPGLVLAAIHLVTLGVLVMTAMGAAFQLLPVATRQPLARNWPARLCFWLFAPGSLLLAYGMAEVVPIALHLGGTAVSAALLLFAWLTADNLRRATSLPLVAAHGWLALGALLGFTGVGLLLVIDLTSGFLADHAGFAATHMVLAAFGFMGALVFGFSYVLIPMFALSRALPARLGWIGMGFATLAVLLGVSGFLSGQSGVLITAMLCAIVASAAYLWQMRRVYLSRMRKRLGPAFITIRLSWGILGGAMLVGLAVLLGVPIPNGATLFGFLMLVGWLLTFLLGILQRIMPFLASMHATPKDGLPPLLSELTAQLPLTIHTGFHFAALVLCSFGIVTELPILITTGAAFGVIGAASFAVFTLLVITRMRG